MRTRYTLFKSETEPIAIIMAILLVTGTINVFSSSYVLAAMNFENPYYFLQRHLVWVFLGLIACWLSPCGDHGKRRTALACARAAQLSAGRVRKADGGVDGSVLDLGGAQQGTFPYGPGLAARCHAVWRDSHDGISRLS